METEEKERENAAQTVAPEEGAVDAEQGIDARSVELRAIGREIAQSLREVIGEEVARALSESAAAVEEAPEEESLHRMLEDPRFLRILSEKLASERAHESAPIPRRRGANPLPASARPTPKTLDDARAAARKYFRVD